MARTGMNCNPEKTLVQIVRQLGRYPIDAFEFLHRGLDYTVQRLHGPAPEGLREIIDWLESNQAEPAELSGLVAEAKLPDELAATIQSLGGADEAARKLNRHVSGEDLCYGLRDLAIEQWGLLAPVVLSHWGVRSTKDFGRMVFALVENGLLQKQPDDTIHDFDEVFDFSAAFGPNLKLGVRPAPAQRTA